MDNIITTLQQLVALDTTPGQPNGQYVQLLTDLVGAKPDVKHDYESNGAQLTAAAWKFPAAPSSQDGHRPLVFVVHTDTVHATKEWTIDPWQLKVEGDNVFGLGTTDMKGGTAALLAALTEAKDHLKRDVWLVADGDEETNVLGGPALRQLLPLTEADVVVIEPTATLIRHRQKGSLTLKITCSGTAVHASEATRAVNQSKSAVEKLRLVLNALAELEGQFDAAEEMFWQPTQTISTITAGLSVNSVADRAELMIDRRFSPREDADDIIAKTEAAVRQADPTAKVESTFVGGGYFTDPKEPFVQQSLAAAQTIEPNFSLGDRPGWSEAAHFNDLGPTIIAGPGVVGQSHQADEQTSLKSLQQYQELYRKLIEL